MDPNDFFQNIQKQEERAQQFKSEGNDHFKSKNYKSAIKSYTKAITATPDNAVLYSNRAMARLKINEYKLAESDCNQCLDLDPLQIKALFRRGLARKGLKKYNRALDDFERILKLEPNNKAAKKERLEMKTKLKAMLQKSKERTFGVPVSSNSKKQKSAVNGTKSKRIVIEECDDSDSDDSDDIKVDSKAVDSLESKSKSKSIIKNTVKIQDEPFVMKRAPSNFIDFEKQWSRAGTNENRAQILLALKHKKLHQIIRNMIDDTLFSQMIHAVHYVGMELKLEDALLILKQMTTLDRFEMIVMFMDDEDQKLLKELQSKCEQSKLDVSVFSKFQ